MSGIRSAEPWPIETLGWLAIEADGELAEILGDARKLARRSGSIPRDAFERAYGTARRETVIRLAIDLGRALITEGAGKSDWLIGERAPQSLQAVRERVTGLDLISPDETSSRLVEVSSGGKRAQVIRVAAAKRAFELAQHLEGDGGRAEVCLAVIPMVEGRFLDAAKQWTQLADRARLDRWRQMAMISCIQALVSGGHIEAALRSRVQADGLRDADLRVALAINRLTLACHAMNPSLVRTAVDRLREVALGSGLEDLALSRAEVLLTWIRRQREQGAGILDFVQRLVSNWTR
jgi:hypothetical protein